MLLALASLSAGYLAWQTMRASEQLSATSEARRATLTVIEGLIGVESAQRGYLLGRTTTDLAAFGAATGRLQATLARLDDTPAAAALRDAATLAVQQLQTAIDLVAAGDAAQAVAASRDAPTRAAMAAAQRLAQAMVDAANGEVSRISAQQRRLGTQVVLAIVLCLLGAAALALLLLRDTRRHLRELAGRESHLHQISATLDQRVAERTRALTEANMRFEIALSATGVTVALQDRDLRFTWISKGEYGLAAAAMLGRTDEEVNPDPSMASVTALKRGVIDTGEPSRREVRVAHDGEERWLDLSVQPVRDEAGAIAGVIAAAIDITRFKEQETRIRLLMREVTHRSLNLLAVIEAIMRQTANNATTVADFEARFSSRLQSLAGSHDLLVQEDWSGASLRALVRSQLGHFADITDSQVEISGPPLHLQPDAAQHIGMALHELAANAARYGALSVPGGKVQIDWRVVGPGDEQPGDEQIELCWQEVGGPPVTPPTRRGFGRIVIERTVARGVQGVVKAEYLPDGLRWTLSFPSTGIVRA
jgi:PAS domain S-box-containing protein